MGMVDKQAEFTRDFLSFGVYALVWCDGHGYTIVLEEGYRHPSATHGHLTSLHHDKLAAHFLLFKNGSFCTDSADYEPLGEAWEAIREGNSWGGYFSTPDGVHFSKAHGGMR